MITNKSNDLLQKKYSCCLNKKYCFLILETGLINVDGSVYFILNLSVIMEQTLRVF